MTKYKSVVFVDLDNTIIEGPFETAVFPIVFQELSDKTGLSISEIRRLIVQENFTRQKDKTISASLSMDWDNITNTVANKLGVNLDSQVLDIVISHVTPPYSIVLDNAIEVLKYIARPDRAIVAATKGLQKYQWPILNGLGILDLFSDVLTPDITNVLKNNMDFYKKWAGLAKNRFSVGDHYDDDVVAPVSFGFFSIWKAKPRLELEKLSPIERIKHYPYPNNGSVYPSAIIFELRELPSVLDELETHCEDYRE